MSGGLGRYLVVGTVGAAAGGLAVARATHALPRLMRGMVAIMIQEMARQGISPDT